MWCPAAVALDRFVVRLAAQRYGKLFGKTTEADYRRSLLDTMRDRLRRPARILDPLPDRLAVTSRRPGRRTPPSSVHRIEIDRGGELVETVFSTFGLGHEGGLLIVYHHGLGEVPNEMSFRRLLLRQRGPSLPADFVCYHATGHREPKEVGRLLSTLTGFQTLMGDSLAAMHAISRALRFRYRRIVYVGLSLGGLVGVVEAALSAGFDLNVSMISHFDMVHTISKTSFRHLVEPRFLASCPLELMEMGLDADRFLAAAQRRLVMVNGIHDDYFRIDLARRAWTRFDRIDHREIPHGHISACAATRCVRGALLDVLTRHRMLG